MSLGAPPVAGAHGTLHPLGPRRDRDMDQSRPPVPPVPRAPRAKPKGQSAGALRRALSKDGVTIGDRPSSTPTSKSETRRPRDESPLAFARRSEISRERADPSNQCFEMGPPKLVDERTDYSRGHSLGTGRASSCPPWRDPHERTGENAPKDHARRSTLRNEQKAADQHLEFEGNGATANVNFVGGEGAHGRRRQLAREEQQERRHASERVETFSRIWGRGDDAG